MAAKVYSPELAHEKAKNTVLVEQVVALEDELCNRDLANFPAVVTDETADFWRDQLLGNRTATLSVLGSLNVLASASADGAPVVAVASRRPLHNRAAVRVVPPSAEALGAAPEVTGLAACIRNRATELVRAERIPFSVAFRRAESELATKR